MARNDELRLIAKVAHLYYGRGARQAEIAKQLDLSQATVSRLLKRAEEEQIVRITVSVPHGTYTELEEELEAGYSLKEAIVVDTVEDDEQILRDLGAAAAFYVESTLKQGELIGISSWSATLLSMVDAMHPLPRSTSAQVVQILGGVGNPAAEAHAAHLTRRMATLTRGDAFFLPAPGVAGSAGAARVYLDDPFVRATMERFDQATLALVGIGAVEPSKLLAGSGNIFSAEGLDLLRERGAGEDICLRFFDRAGPAAADAAERARDRDAAGAAPAGLALCGHRRAGGASSTPSAARSMGRWISVLITDRRTAEVLVARSTRRSAGAAHPPH